MERTPTRRGLAALSVAAGLLAASTASAHPHMWIDARAVIDLDADKRITAVRQVWRFDEMFGAYATQGLKKGKDGSLAADTRAGMARDWMKALGEPISHYFTRVSVDGKSAAFAAPMRAWTGTRRPAACRWPSRCRWPSPWRWARTAQIDIYDPTYFVAYAFDEKDAVTLGGPQAAACKRPTASPRNWIGRPCSSWPRFRPTRTRCRKNCSPSPGPDAPHRGPLPVMRPAGTLRAWSTVLALALAALLAWAGPAWAQSAHPFGVPESGGGMAGAGWLAGFFGQVSAWQTHFAS